MPGGGGEAGVGGAGGGEVEGRDGGAGEMGEVKGFGFAAVEADAGDGGAAEQGREIDGADVAEVAVHGAFDFAFGGHVPEGDAGADEEGFLFGDGGGDWFVPEAGEGFPEAVLRPKNKLPVSIVSPSYLPGNDGIMMP